MMRVILIRHGQTNHNNERVFQADNENLNEQGVRQVRDFVDSHRQMLEDVDEIRHSPLLRAKMSAELLADAAQAPLVSDSSLVEFMNPPEIRGAGYDDSAADGIYREWIRERTIPRTIGKDGVESYYDMMERAKEVLRSLYTNQHETILIVSHSEFIRMIAALVIGGEDLTVEAAVKSMKSMKLRNARSITLELHSSGWRVAF